MQNFFGKTNKVNSGPQRRKEEFEKVNKTVEEEVNKYCTQIKEDYIKKLMKEEKCTQEAALEKFSLYKLELQLNTLREINKEAREKAAEEKLQEDAGKSKPKETTVS